jgi:lipopolysaccharide export system protein LptA
MQINARPEHGVKVVARNARAKRKNLLLTLNLKHCALNSSAKMPGREIISLALAPRLRPAAVGATIAFCLFVLAGAARGQAPSGARLSKNPSWIFYRMTPAGQVPEARFGGTTATSISGPVWLVKDFQLTTFRDTQGREIQLIAQGPECYLDYNIKIAWDAGPVKMFTPTTNLYTQGIGFFCNQTNELLIISNQVQTRVVKAMLKTPLMGAANAPDGSGQVVQIFADYSELHYNSNVVTYSGHVHVIDPQMDITSKTMVINFTTNGTVNRILWSDDVVVTTTNKGRATAATALYFITNGNEMLELSGDATWENSGQQAWAGQFTYEPDRHFLTATNHVRVRWPGSGSAHPEAAAGSSIAPPAANAATNFLGMTADFATVQSAPENGQVQIITATGGVVITNEADHSHSFSQRAVFNRTNDWLELTGQPVWENDQIQVAGWALAMQLSNKVYRAEGQARLKMRLAQTVSGANHPAANQWLLISSSTIDYNTNLANFTEPVQAGANRDGVLLDTLTCKLLTLQMGASNQVQTAIARGNVHAETIPAAGEPKRTISCQTLTARRSPETLRLERVEAEQNVIIEVITTGTNAAYNRLTADTASAAFFADTNRVQRAEAEGNVTFEQIKGPKKLQATGEKAVYQGEPIQQVELTGHPWAKTEKVMISDADAMSWDVKSSSFSASGLFSIVPVDDVTTNAANAHRRSSR